MHQWTGPALVQVMAYRLFSTKPLSKPMLPYCQLGSWEQISVKFELEFYHFHSRKWIWKCCLPEWWPFCPGVDELSPGYNTLNSLTPGGCGIDFNSLAPGKCKWNFRYVIFKQILVNDGWGISCEIDLIWMTLDFTDDQSTLVQVMAWCHQATSHYLSQCWSRSLSPYGVTRPQWVN